MADEGVPGGYGAVAGRGGGRVIEPYVPPTYGYDSGTYTDPITGKPISKKEAEEKGIIDKPGEASAKIAAAGATKPQAYTPPPVGLEALKAAELTAARQETLRRQSEISTTPGEALAIQRMLRSPTAQFASQEAAQRGYELASRYDRSFAPEQVRATLVPQYQPSLQQEPSRFFYPAPKEQAGIRPTFPTPARPGSIAERAAFERRRAGFYTYGTVRRLEAVSSRLQEGFERTIGYDERSSIPVKATTGFVSAFTGLPAFVGQVAGAGEAIIRYPSTSLRGFPTGFKILSKQVSEQATTKPIEFAGSLAGMATIGRYTPKVSVSKPTSAGLRELARSETAMLAPRRAQSSIIQEQKFINPLVGGVKTSYKPMAEVRKTQLDIETGRLVRFEVRSVAAQRSGYKAQQEYGRKLKTSIVPPEQTYKQVSSQIIGQKSKAIIIPYSIQAQKQISKQEQVTSQINRQVARQVPRTTPIIVQRQKQRQLYTQVPVPMQLQRQIQTQVPIQVQKQVQKQEQMVRQKPVRPQRVIERRPPTIERIKPIEKPRAPKSVSSMFKRSSSILKGGRKYTTALGGKTLKQLQAELTGKKRKR